MASILELAAFYQQQDADQLLEEHNAAMQSLNLSETSAPAGEPGPDNNSTSTPAAMEADDGAAGGLAITNTVLAGMPLLLPPAPNHTGPPLTYHDTKPGDLPEVVKDEIFAWLLGVQLEIDLTIPHAKRGVAQLRFTSWFPHLRRAFSTYLLTCKGMRADGLAYLSRTTLFVNRYGDSVRNLPTVFGAEATAMIRRFDLTLHFLNKTRPEGHHPALLKMLAESMPQLSRLRLISDYPADGQDYPQNETGDTAAVARYPQERRALFRIGAFLTLRHPLLKLMVLPAVSGPRFAPYEARVTEWVELYENTSKIPVRSMMKKSGPDATEQTEHKDLLLNSTAIRRLKWTELALEDPTKLAAPTDAETSEIPEEDNDFHWVDRKGYLVQEDRDQKQLGRWQPVDGLIDNARTNKQQDQDREASRGARGGRGSRGGHRGDGNSGRGATGRGATGRGRGLGRGRGGGHADGAALGGANGLGHVGGQFRGRGFGPGRGRGLNRVGRGGRGGRGGQS